MFDLDEPTEVLIFAFVGNILNLAYNIPFVYLVWQNRSSKNISGTFLSLRFCGSVSWLVYAALVNDAWVAFSYAVTLIATILISYIKCGERKNKNLDFVGQGDLSAITNNSNFKITEAEPHLQITCV